MLSPHLYFIIITWKKNLILRVKQVNQALREIVLPYQKHFPVENKFYPIFFSIICVPRDKVSRSHNIISPLMRFIFPFLITPRAPILNPAAAITSTREHFLQIDLRRGRNVFKTCLLFFYLAEGPPCSSAKLIAPTWTIKNK